MAVDAPKKENQQSTVEETIDPKILEILGLEDVFDFTYEEYLTLLKEKMVAGRMSGSSMPTEDVEAVTDEYKRVKGKKGKIKIKTTKKKISAGKFFNKEDAKDEKSISGSQSKSPKLLPGTADVKPDSLKKEEKDSDLSTLLPIVTEIRKISDDILSTLKDQLNFKKKLSGLSRRESEKGARGAQEAKLESKPDKAGENLAEKATKPFSSFLDNIIRFITMTFLGAAVQWLLNIFKNPKKFLLQPIQNLIDGITGFFNNVLQWIDKNLIGPIRGFVNLIEAGINAFIGIINQALKFIPGSPQLPEVDIPNVPNIPELKGPNILGEEKPEKEKEEKVQTKSGGGLVLNLKNRGGNVNVTNKSGNVNVNNNVEIKKQKTKFSNKKLDPDKGFSKTGGKVTKSTGVSITGLGKDTQLTALQPEEFVLVPGAAKFLGIPLLEELNKKFGGDNKDRYASLGKAKVRTAQGGGRVNPASSKPKPSKPTESEKTSTKGVKKEEKGGGQSAVITTGKALLQKGFTIDGHPNFRKNSYSGKGANTGKGFNPAGGEPVGKHSDGSAHYKGLAIDVTDFRGGDWLGRTKQLAQYMYENRKQYKLTQIIHDGWGSWFNGEPSFKPGKYGGHGEHLHLAFAAGPGGSGTIDLSGSGGGSGGGGGAGEEGASLDEEGNPVEESPPIDWAEVEKWMVKTDMGGAVTPSSPSSTSGSSSMPSVPSSPSTSSSSATLDPTKTGASNPAVFAAAQKARAEARALGLPPAEVEKRVIAASIAAKQGRTTVSASSITPAKSPLVPGPPVKQSPTLLPLASGGNKNSQPTTGSMSGITGTPAVHFPSENYSESAHRTAVKSQLNILEY